MVNTVCFVTKDKILFIGFLRNIFDIRVVATIYFPNYRALDHITKIIIVSAFWHRVFQFGKMIKNTFIEYDSLTAYTKQGTVLFLKLHILFMLFVPVVK